MKQTKKPPLTKRQLKRQRFSPFKVIDAVKETVIAKTVPEVFSFQRRVLPPLTQEKTKKPPLTKRQLKRQRFSPFKEVHLHHNY